MTVRDALLGLLTIGPAYGLQLHAELGTRAPHRTHTNVGQVYGTLDRLSRAGLVTSAGLTSDGLPLYTLTRAGSAAATSWLAGTVLTELPEWADIQDMVLISSSIDSTGAESLVSVLTRLCGTASTPSGDTAISSLHSAAQRRYRESVQAWLTDVVEANIPADPQFALGRPKRGRPARN